MLPKDVACWGVYLPESNTDSAEYLVDFLKTTRERRKREGTRAESDNVDAA